MALQFTILPVLCSLFLSATYLGASEISFWAPLYGVAASILTGTSEKTACLAEQLCPDIVETKTFRNTERDAHSVNVAYIDGQNLPSGDVLRIWDRLEQPFIASSIPPDDMTYFALANAVGMPSPDTDRTKEIVARTLALFQEHAPRTKLMFSIHGSSPKAWVDMACMGKKLGVPYVCANFSCPNITNGNLLYKDPESVGPLVAAMKKVLGTVPLVIKVGVYKPKERLIQEKVIDAIASNGGDVIYGINAVTASVINQDGTPTFGIDHRQCGLSGPFIRSLGLEWVRTTRNYIEEHKLKLKIFACGGACTEADFRNYIAAGADAVFVASAIIANAAFRFPQKMMRSKL
jgi:dihydroorotate dehydrogenase